jgi:ADP-ribose pyrophosphatase
MAHRGVEADPRARILTRHRTHAGPLLKVDEDRVALSNGNEATLESIRHPGAAAALPFVDADTVLLVRQYRHAMGGFILEVPAGKLDDGEAPEVCARREVEEEVGQRVGSLVELGAIFTTPGFTDEVIWLYEAHDLVQTSAALEADEVLDVQRWSFSDALEAVLDGRIRDGKSVATLLHAARRR